MPHKTRIIVYGNSLYMASLAAGLGANPGLSVTRIAASPPAGPDGLRELQVDVIAFDLVELPVELPVALLRACPHLLLLGLDPTSEELFVLSGHHARAISVADLVSIITGHAPTDIVPPSAST